MFKKYFVMTMALSVSHVLFAERLSNIVITGNKRIEAETIRSYLPIKVGGDFTEQTADAAVRDLYNTGYFVDVKVKKHDGTLSIEVLENPIVNQIVFEGNDKLKDEQIEKDVDIKPRKILSRTDIQNAQQRILEMYRRMGRFNAKVDPKIIRLDNNRVNLVFEIQEGDVTNIEKIIFVGNKVFSSTVLEEHLLSKRYKWWRFFASDDVYDPDRFMADQQALRQHYANNGHPDFRIVSAVSELSPDKKEFYLTFMIDEGSYYSFGKQTVVSKIKDVPVQLLEKEITFSEGDMYSAKEIEKTVTAITEALGDKGYAFVSVEPVVQKDPQTKKASLTFEIKEGPRVYVERITIKGNDRTHDNVVRRELTIHEGDAYNTSKIKNSENKIKDLGYFKSVVIDTEQGQSSDQTQLNVIIEEQSTGQIKLSGGYSTLDGPVINLGFSEQNFMGRGQTVHADVSLAKRMQEFNMGIIEPYLFNRPLTGSFDVFSTRSSRIEAFTNRSTGFNTGLGYHLTPNLIQNFTYSLHKDKISIMEDHVSPFIRHEKRNTLTSSLAHTLKYDRRDSVQDPTRGYVLKMVNTYAGLGGDVFYLRNDFSATVFYTPLESVLTFAQLDFGRIHKVGKRTLRVSDCIFLGGDTFKGFEYSGIGPRDVLSRNKDPLGGRKYWKGTVESQFPIGLPADFGIKGAAFSQFGSVWDSVAKNNINYPNRVWDKNKIRVSVGFGIIWRGPFGPLRIDYAKPIVKSRHDVEQRINLSYALPL